MTTRCAIAIDLGTTSISAVAVDPEGRLLRAVTRHHHADVAGLPPGWAEQDPQLIRAAADAVLRELSAGLTASPVCLGLTGQMHGVVLLDAALQPVSRLITWQDRRALQPHPHGGGTLLEALWQRCNAESLARTGCRPAAGFLATTLYVLRETGQLPREAARAALVVDWLAAVLTGAELTTDRSNAASTGLYDLERDEWSPALLTAANVRPELLPPVADGGSPQGRLTSDAAARTGLPAGLPVCTAIGDNQAAIVGSIPPGEDVIHINLGTGGQFSRIVTGFRRVAGLETRFLPPDRYMLVGAGLAGGDALAWVQRTLSAWWRAGGLELSEAETYARLDALMDAAPDDAGGLECVPYFRGTRADPAARGVFRGVDNQNFTPGAVGRAVLNGIAAAMVELQGVALQAGPWPARRVIATGNAVRRNPRLIRRIASLLRLPVDLPAHREEAAYGAALLAGSQTGLWPDLAAAGTHIRHERAAEPAAP